MIKRRGRVTSSDPLIASARTARSPLNGAEIPLGAHPGNTGGKKRRSGRKPDAWRAFCGDVRNDPKVRANVLRAARSNDAKSLAPLLRLLSEDAGEKRATPHAVDHKGSPVTEVVFRVVEEDRMSKSPPRS